MKVLERGASRAEIRVAKETIINRQSAPTRLDNKKPDSHIIIVIENL